MGHIVSAPQNTMLRHAENCMGEIIGEENGTPTPTKKGRRGRKRKMQAKRDDDDEDNTGMIFSIDDIVLLFIVVIMCNTAHLALQVST